MYVCMYVAVKLNTLLLTNLTSSSVTNNISGVNLKATAMLNYFARYFVN